VRGDLFIYLFIYLFIMQITCHVKRVTGTVIQTVKTNLQERHINTTADMEHEKTIKNEPMFSNEHACTTATSV